MKLEWQNADIARRWLVIGVVLFQYIIRNITVSFKGSEEPSNLPVLDGRQLLSWAGEDVLWKGKEEHSKNATETKTVVYRHTISNLAALVYVPQYRQCAWLLHSYNCWAIYLPHIDRLTCSYNQELRAQCHNNSSSLCTVATTVSDILKKLIIRKPVARLTHPETHICLSHPPQRRDRTVDSFRWGVGRRPSEISMIRSFCTWGPSRISHTDSHTSMSSSGHIDYYSNVTLIRTLYRFSTSFATWHKVYLIWKPMLNRFYCHCLQ